MSAASHAGFSSLSGYVKPTCSNVERRKISQHYFLPALTVFMRPQGIQAASGAKYCSSCRNQCSGRSGVCGRKLAACWTAVSYDVSTVHFISVSLALEAVASADSFHVAFRAFCLFVSVQHPNPYPRGRTIKNRLALSYLSEFAINETAEVFKAMKVTMLFWIVTPRGLPTYESMHRHIPEKRSGV